MLYKAFYKKFIPEKISKFLTHSKSKSSHPYYSYIYHNQEPYWIPRSYEKFSEEAYVKNVIAHRAINLVAQGAASVPWLLYKVMASNMHEIKHHPLLTLLHQPNPSYGGAEFFENIYAYRMISGNAFIQIIQDKHSQLKELHLLRPDRITILPGKRGIVEGYYYGNNEEDRQFFPVNSITGKSQILHLKTFNPVDDWYGLSPVEAAAYSIDQHNNAAIWNQSLLQNGARPSGAVVVKANNNHSGNLTEEQYQHLKAQVEEQYIGAANAGRPLLLEGGLEWQEMSLSPKDMDFIEAKNSAARDIALAFGVPPQLLGLPGDNKYSNMQEARLALWEDTILPLLDHTLDALNHWLTPQFGKDLKLSYNKDDISALITKRENIWSRVQNCNFMTINEKRAAVGLSPISNGD